jgi:hypothetical protein
MAMNGGTVYGKIQECAHPSNSISIREQQTGGQLSHSIFPLFGTGRTKHIMCSRLERNALNRYRFDHQTMASQLFSLLSTLLLLVALLFHNVQTHLDWVVVSSVHDNNTKWGVVVHDVPASKALCSLMRISKWWTTQEYIIVLFFLFFLFFHFSLLRLLWRDYIFQRETSGPIEMGPWSKPKQR